MEVKHTSGRHGASIEIMEVAERWDEVEGRFPFTGTVVVYRSLDQVFHCLLHGAQRPQPSEYPTLLPLLSASLATLIPPDAYAPVFQTDGSLSRVSAPFPADVFVKRPSLGSFDRYVAMARPNDIASAILNEARVGEILKHNLHPNVARYHGCEVSDEGRITGVCWTTLGDSLMKRVNPGFIGKAVFQYRPGTLRNKDKVVDGIRAGLLHLHSLGFVHNDINPANILLDGDENPVIVDFGSCTPIGQSLEGVGRTYQWYDESVNVASPSNDIYALEDIQEWLREDGGRKEFHYCS